MAQSNTYPETLARSRGKTLYRFNINEVELVDELGGEPRTAYEYDEVAVEGKVTKAKVIAAMRAAEADVDAGDIATAAVQYQDAMEVVNLSNLAQMTYAQLDTYIQNNVTDMASARDFLQKVSRVVLAILKSQA